MRILITILLISILSATYGQDVRVKRSIVDQALYLKDRWLEEVKNDTNNLSAADRSLMTAKAIYELVNARASIPGPQGEQGLQGLQGAPGAPGVNGADGSRWFDQAGAPNPNSGTIGDFSINSITGDFFEKTGVNTWTIRGNLRGPQGLQGLQGAPGADGTNGANGAKGDKGDKGEDGTSVTIKGTYHDVGSLPGAGNPGDGYMVGDSLWVWDQLNDNWHNVGRIRGLQGEQGVQGTPGSRWFDQAGTPNPANGVIGDFHLNRTTGDYYEKTGVNTWTNRGNIRGPQGLQGAQGAKGDKGDKGDTGSTGATGATGQAGAPGAKQYFGIGTPSSGLGVNGDTYINRLNGDLYSRVSGSWNVEMNIKGPAGSGGGQIINVDL